METENYQIDGKKGNWIATDTIIIDGKQFYLMEHQVYRDQDVYKRQAYYYFKIYKPKKEEDEDDQPEGLETGGLEEVPDEEESCLLYTSSGG